MACQREVIRHRVRVATAAALDKENRSASRKSRGELPVGCLKGLGGEQDEHDEGRVETA